MPNQSQNALIDDSVRAVRAGNKMAFAQIVNAFEAELRMWVSAHSLPGIDIDSVAQSTFVAAYTNLHEYELGTNFSAWLFTIARYQLRTETTRMARIADYHSRIAPDLLRRELERRSNDSPEQHEARKAYLQACLKSLNKDLLRYLAWRYEEGLSLEGMSQLSGKSVASIKKRLWSIRKTLRSCIERQERRSAEG